MTGPLRKLWWEEGHETFVELLAVYKSEPVAALVLAEKPENCAVIAEQLWAMKEGLA